MKLHNTMTPDEEDALEKHLGERKRRSGAAPLLGIGDRLKLYFDNFEAVWHVTKINDGVVTLARNGSNMAIDWSQLFLDGLMEHLRKGGAVKMAND